VKGLLPRRRAPPPLRCQTSEGLRVNTGKTRPASVATHTAAGRAAPLHGAESQHGERSRRVNACDFREVTVVPAPNSRNRPDASRTR